MPGNTTVSSSGTSSRSLTIVSLSNRCTRYPDCTDGAKGSARPPAAAFLGECGHAGAVVDPGAGLEIEEVEALGDDGERHRVALPRPRDARDPGDERAAVVRLLVRRLERLVADDLAQLVGLDGRGGDDEVEVDLRAHVLPDIDGDLEARAGRHRRAERILDVLRADPQADAPADVAPELRPCGGHGSRHRQGV